ncbi:MAG: phosphorylase [Alphaproteobacteria bacterium]
MNAKLGIVTGLAFEAKVARSANTPGIEVLCLGPGPQNAGAAAATLVERGVQALMSFGVAGALDPALEAGALVVPDAIQSNAGETIPCDPDLSDLLREGGHTVGGTLLGVDQAVDTVGAKAAAFEQTCAVAVDMESHSVAYVAQESGVRMIAARAIIDPAHQQLPSSVLAGAKPGGGLNIGGLLLGLLKNPAEIADVARLARQNRAAQKALRDLAAFRFAHLFLGEEI